MLCSLLNSSSLSLHYGMQAWKGAVLQQCCAELAVLTVQSVPRERQAELLSQCCFVQNRDDSLGWLRVLRCTESFAEPLPLHPSLHQRNSQLSETGYFFQWVVSWGLLSELKILPLYRAISFLSRNATFNWESPLKLFQSAQVLGGTAWLTEFIAWVVPRDS